MPEVKQVKDQGGMAGGMMGRKQGEGINVLHVACTCLLFDYSSFLFHTLRQPEANNPVIWRDNTTRIITISLNKLILS